MLAQVGTPFIPHWFDLKPFVVELWLIATIVAVLITPFFTRSRSNIACALVSLAGLAMAMISLLVVSRHIGEVSGERLRGLLVSDAFALFWKAMLLVFVAGIILLWLSVSAWNMHEGDGPEFFTLLLGATLGMSLMASTSNLLMIFISVEMASLPSYVMAGFRKTNRIGAEASLKYVLFGAATSAIMAYGLSILYGLYGTLDVNGPAGLAARMAASTGGGALLAVAVFGLIVGIGFKISAVPFHFWCPDVFEGASVDVSAFLSVASKGAALALLLRQVMIIADAAGYQNVPHVSLTAIAGVLGVLGAITATVGNTGAFVQTNIKRLLAYSSIAHAGYMLCALSLLVNHNAKVTTDGLNAPAQVILLYLAVYLFMNLGAFTIAGLVYRQTGSEQIADYAGLGRRSPVLAACMFCFMISLIGLPPFAGFVAKLNLLLVLINNGGWWWWLVVAIGINTILSAFYYFRVIKAMYVTDSDEPAFAPHPLGSAMAICCAIVLVMMLIGYSPFSGLTKAFAQVNGVSGNPWPVYKPPVVAARAGTGAPVEPTAASTAGPGTATPSTETPTAPAASGGGVSGVVKLDGPPPQMAKIDMSGVAQCAQQHSTPVYQETVVTGADGGLANVVVSIRKEEGVALPSVPPGAPAVLDQHGCQYVPHVVALMKDQPLLVRNSDPFLHNVHTLPEKNEGENKAQPNVDPGSRLKTPKEAEYFRVKCDVHPWMGAWVAVLDNPYFAVTDKDGKFALPKGLADGEYTLVAWHEKFGTQQAKVTVKDGAGTANFVFK
jgi:NADH-quinone oxidoreductase subunit N